MPDGMDVRLEGDPRNLPPIPERLIAALDMDSVAAAQDMVARLDGVVSFFKIGLYLFCQQGVNQLIDSIIDSGKKVFLDYKMFDIGATVKRGVESAVRRNISFLTVHGDPEIMENAVAGKGTSELKIFAISVLTSLNDSSLKEMGYDISTKQLIELRVKNAIRFGCDGIIASADDNPDEIRRLVTAPKLLIATPGIRLDDGSKDDHKRLSDPASAIEKGADYLVVGRPIIESPDPIKAAQRIIREMEAGWTKRVSKG